MKKSISAFLEKFRRITSGESYMPEIDGLRFIAVFWVVVMMHTSNFVNVKFYNGELFSGYISGVILEGGQGVSFFFIISGFILGLPFARQKMQGGRKVSLKNYYVRRLTRLEPPYLAALLIAFAGLVFLKNYSFVALLPHLGASAIYSHGFIYGTKSTVLGIAWSLELEVQFYILAPFLAFLFSIKKPVLRRSVFIVLIIFFTAIAYRYLWIGYPSILKSPHCFLIGMFLCDLYINKVSLPGKINAWFVAGIGIFFLLPFFLSLYDFTSFFFKTPVAGPVILYWAHEFKDEKSTKYSVGQYYWRHVLFYLSSSICYHVRSIGDCGKINNHSSWGRFPVVFRNNHCSGAVRQRGFLQAY